VIIEGDTPVVEGVSPQLAAYRPVATSGGQG
jgi:hypothetical protein